MKKYSFTFIIIALAICTSLRSQTLDEILKKYYAANSQDSLLKVNSVRTTGRMIQGSLEIPFTQVISRPASYRFDLTFQGLNLISTFNGKEGWNVNPMSGSSAPQPYSDDDIKSTFYQVDIDGMLWKSADKGYTLTYDGKDDMEGTECFILKIVTKQGDIFKFYIDSDSYILLRTYSKIKILGNQSEGDSYFSNYMLVRGIPLPGKIESKSNGQLVATNIVDKIEMDVNLSPDIFEKPKTAK